MSFERPGFKPNIQRNQKMSRANDVFFTIPPDKTARLRFLPPATEDGLVFTLSVNHFKINDAEGKSIALACLNQHGEGECPTCAIVDELYRSSDAAAKKLANELRASARYNAQVLLAEKDADTGKMVYEGPRMIGLSKTVADDIIQFLVNQESAGDDFFCDADKGQDLFLTRKGSGFSTKYTIDRSGQKAALDDILPGWQEKFWTDPYKVLGLKVVDRDTMLALLKGTYANQIDFDGLKAAGII